MRQSFHILNTVILSAILLGCLLVSFWYTPPGSWGNTGCNSPANGFISGLTGRLFEGDAVRQYNGKLIFAGSLPAAPAGPTKHGNITSSKWAVVTTIFKPNEAILATASLHGWAVVVVGDKGAVPFNASAPNMVYLDVAAQQQLSTAFGGFINLLPWKHFGRKNIGFLYAIVHGAQLIWDFDDDNALKPGLEPQMPSSEVYHVQLDSSCSTFNPYPHMGAPPEGSVETWPRGYPLNLIKRPCKHTLVPGTCSKVAVVQSLADHEPDVDGLFRLTRKIPFTFDPGSKQTLVIPRGVFTPYNAQATLTMQSAFWSMLLPVSVHGRVSDIWRSYVAQRLLWDIGQQLAFSPPMVNQFRNPHNPLADMDAEHDLYLKSLALVKYLKEWQGTAPTLQGRYEELVIGMYERQYVGWRDVELAQQWLLALTIAGYDFPSLAPHAVGPQQALYVYTEPGLLHNVSRQSHPTGFLFGHSQEPLQNEGFRYVNASGVKPFKCLASYSRHFKDVLLVMQFSHRLPKNREQELHKVYACFFTNIVQYSCKCNSPGVEAGGMHCLQCPPAVKQGSELQYMFMLDAMKAHPDYSGYLFMQEDVVLGFWNFPARHSRDKVWRALTFPDPDPAVWLQHQNMSLNNASKHSTVASYWTRHADFPLYGVQEFVRGFAAEEQQRLFRLNSATNQETFKMAFSDVYYIPAKYRQQVIQHFERALAHGVFHEIAVPIVLDVIVPDGEFELIVGGALWQVTDTVKKISLYDPCWDFYHKIKSSDEVQWVWLVETVLRYGSMAGSWDCGQLGAEGLTTYARIQG